MPTCAFCGAGLDGAGRVMRKDQCPSCRRDLHCCVQCRLHDRGYHNQCHEPKADMVADRDKMNVCDYFEFKGGANKPDESEPDRAKQALEALFKKR